LSLTEITKRTEKPNQIVLVQNWTFGNNTVTLSLSKGPITEEVTIRPSVVVSYCRTISVTSYMSNFKQLLNILYRFLFSSSLCAQWEILFRNTDDSALCAMNGSFFTTRFWLWVWQFLRGNPDQITQPFFVINLISN
jgi:hypothetical protein